MRKILTSVLSVAGLMAVVLALATSPASAAKDVITVTTATTAGVYTLSWETSGGCNPGAGTSGGSGSLVLTVTSTDQPTSPPVTGQLSGDIEADFVTVDDDCHYEWTGSFIDAASKASCGVGGVPEDDAAEDTPDAITFTVEVANCAEGGLITVTVSATPTSTEVALCEQADVDAAVVGAMCGTGAVVGAVKSTTHSYDSVSRGAVKSTTFVVTATPVSNSHPACQETSGETEVINTGATQVKLFLVGNEAIVEGDNTDVNCSYDVVAAVPAGFSGGAKDTNEVTATPAAVIPVNPTVVVATRAVYLVQTVNGDSGGAYATYRLNTAATPDNDVERCTAGLPPALTGTQSGGIITSTTVELREGRFNIGGAVAAIAGRPAYAMDNKAVPCWADSTVKNLPDHCTTPSLENAAARNLVEDADDDGNVLVEHVITCAEAAAEEPAAEVMDDGDAEVMDDGDAEVMDDGDAEVMDDGDAEVMDDGDAEVMDDGPAMDTPTG